MAQPITEKGGYFYSAAEQMAHSRAEESVYVITLLDNLKGTEVAAQRRQSCVIYYTVEIREQRFYCAREKETESTCYLKMTCTESI